MEMLEKTRIKPGRETAEVLEDLGTTPLSEPQSAARLFRRPQVGFSGLLRLLDESERLSLANEAPEVIQQLSINAQYSGYIERQREAKAREKAREQMRIREDVVCSRLAGITTEARSKLEGYRPETVG